MPNPPPHPPINPQYPHPHPETLQHELVTKCLNASIAAVIATVLMYPFDLSKTRLQNQRNSPDAPQLYKSLLDCFRKIKKNEGFRGMYRGCTVNVLFIAPEKTIKLTANDMVRKYLKGSSNRTLSISEETLAGAISGVAQSILSTPMDLLKINLQDAGRLAAMKTSTMKQAKATSARKVAAKLLRTHGITGFFKGLSITGTRNTFFSMIYFPCFFQFNNWGTIQTAKFPRLKEYLSSPSTFFSGCLAGAVAACCATPLDVVKTRTQRLKLAKTDVKYTGMLDAFVKIVKTEGPLALMKGAGIRMMTIAPLFGIIQAVYFMHIGESILTMIEQEDNGNDKDN